jgi:AraC-like DNA-binding protein
VTNSRKGAQSPSPNADGPHEAEATVSARMLWPLLRALRESPAHIRRVLSEHELREVDVRNPELRLPARVCYDAYARAAALTGNAAFGLHAGAHARPSDLGLIHYLALSSQNLRQVVTLGTRYAALLCDELTLSLDESASDSHVRFAAAGAPPVVMDALAAGLARTIGARLDLDAPSIAGSRQRLPLKALHVAHARPPYAAQYEKLFGLEPVFRADHYAFVLPHEALDAPLLHADAEVREQLEQKAAELLRNRTAHRTWTARVYRVVREAVHEGQPTISDIARLLGTSRATLNRRLAHEQTTFSDILGRVRVDLGTHYLRTSSLSIAEISHALGFSEVAAFHRAFKRWTSENPGDYRERHRAGTRESPDK